MRQHWKKINQAGVTLIGAIVAIGITAIITAAGMTLTGNLSNSQKQIQIANRALMIRENLVAFIKNRSAWEATLNNNGAATACLRNNTDCSALIGVDTDIDIYFPDGTLYYQASSATAGFKLNVDSNNVETCSTFSTAAPVDTCPFRVRIRWQPLCTGTPCLSPKVQVWGEFQTSAAIIAKRPFFHERYGFRVVRGGDNQYHKIVVVDQQASGTNGGVATTGSFVNRVFQTTITDTGGNVLSLPTNTGVQLRAGIYECDISAPAYKVNGHRISIVNETDSNNVLIEGMSAYSPNGTQSDYGTRSHARGRFTLNIDSTIRVRHYTSNSAASALELGRPTGWGNEVYSVFKCIKEL